MTTWYDPHPPSKPSTRITPPDVNVYRNSGATVHLCAPCARARRDAGRTVDVVGESGGRCEDCQANA
jgi:hypothetical protein